MHNKVIPICYGWADQRNSVVNRLFYSTIGKRGLLNHLGEWMSSWIMGKSNTIPRKRRCERSQCPEQNKISQGQSFLGAELAQCTYHLFTVIFVALSKCLNALSRHKVDLLMQGQGPGVRHWPELRSIESKSVLQVPSWQGIAVSKVSSSSFPSRDECFPPRLFDCWDDAWTCLYTPRKAPGNTNPFSHKADYHSLELH